MVKQQNISVPTKSRTEWIDITAGVEDVIAKSKIQNGICVVASLHTTAGITINENADPDVGRDFFYKLNQMVPQDPLFHHNEGNSDSHIKASLVGLSVHMPVTDGRIVTGTWQSVYFCEFDGPRRRTVSVTVIGE